MIHDANESSALKFVFDINLRWAILRRAGEDVAIGQWHAHIFNSENTKVCVSWDNLEN